MSVVGADPDATLVERLRAGEQAAFAELVQRYSGAVMRLARVYVPTTAVAEEVAQETWVRVLRGLERFERRSSFRTWLFQIALNQARTRGERERRTIPFASFADREIADEAPAVDPERFLGADHDRWPHHWATPPRRWDESPDRHAESAETLARVREAIERLPPAQRVVITLRDMYGCESAEVCTGDDSAQDLDALPALDKSIERILKSAAREMATTMDARHRIAARVSLN